MITWRHIAIDLRLLSNGVLLYGLVYFLGFGAYYLSFGSTSDISLIQVLPLFGLNLILLTHIANERADRVADNITVLLGGRASRIATRMISTAIYNVVLVSTGTLLVLWDHAWQLRLQPWWWVSTLWILAIYSTAGVVLAAALPHPLVAITVTSIILFAGGASSDTNLLMHSILTMTDSQSWAVWFTDAGMFAWPWLLVALALAPVALGRQSVRIHKFDGHQDLKALRIPAWASWKSNFATRTFLISITNPLPILGSVAAILTYTYSSVLLAAKYASLDFQGTVFPMLTGIVLVNVMPAALLSTSVHGREVNEQESFLHRSSAQAFRSRLAQTSLVLAFISAGMLAMVANITGTSWNSPEFRKGIIELLYLTPSLTVIAMAVGWRLRSPIALAMTSYALTLPELLLSRLLPSTTGWLPSSIFAQVAGGPGLYVNDRAQSAPYWMAVCLVALLGLAPFLPIAFTGLSEKRYRSGRGK
jgi:hypothetical protein